MSSTRPGNKERGWNDPPELLHTNLNTLEQASHRNLLNKRVNYNFNQNQSAQASSSQCSSFPSAPPQAPLVPIKAKSCNVTRIQSDNEAKTIHLSYIEQILDSKVEYLRAKGVSSKITDEVSKRIKIFSNNWDKLSENVKIRMNDLVDNLQSNDLNKANDVHLKLIMDFASEVSLWMVGIKKLIHELKEN